MLDDRYTQRLDECDGGNPVTRSPQAIPAPAKKVCTCGTPVDCTAHD